MKLDWKVVTVWVISLLICFLFWIAILRAESPQIGIVVKSTDKGEIVAAPVIAPYFFFSFEGVRPEKGLLLCTQVADKETVAGHTYPVVRLNCGNTILTVSGIAFQ